MVYRSSANRATGTATRSLSTLIARLSALPCGREANVERVLAPTLESRQAMVLGNLEAHKRDWVRELVGAGLRAVVPTVVLAELQSDLGGVRQGEGAAEAGRGAHPRGPGGSDGSRFRRGDDSRRWRLLRTLRPSPSGPIAVAGAVEYAQALEHKCAT